MHDEPVTNEKRVAGLKEYIIKPVIPAEPFHDDDQNWHNDVACERVDHFEYYKILAQWWQAAGS